MDFKQIVWKKWIKTKKKIKLSIVYKVRDIFFYKIKLTKWRIVSEVDKYIENKGTSYEFLVKYMFKNLTHISKSKCI